MAYEDVDWCLRAWQAGCRVALLPAARSSTHHESVTRGTEPGERERRLAAALLGALGRLLRRARDVRTADGRLRDRLRDRGHRRRRRAPRHLRAPQPPARRAATTSRCTRSASARLVRPARPGAQLRGLRRARRRARASSTRSRSRPGGTRRRRCGARACCAASRSTSSRTSRRPTTPTTSAARHAVLDSYRPEFRYMTISGVEPRAPARAGPRRRARSRPGIDLDDLPPAATTWRAARTWCSRSGAPTR